MSIAKDSHKIVVTTTDAHLYPGQVQLVNELLPQIPNIIIVSVRTPYDINVLSPVPTFLAAYGGNTPTLRAIADVLMGKFQPSGVLPVTSS
jgi:beta-N-acetylhexosaminidase